MYRYETVNPVTGEWTQASACTPTIAYLTAVGLMERGRKYGIDYRFVAIGDTPDFVTLVDNNSMTVAEIAAWFTMRGVDDKAQLALLVREYAGSTKDVMDRMYADLHGMMA